ncbi:DUF4249 domain-containing protein [Algoriphagus sp. AGSA1]|uniref:DUF4249 domain-containing protein n=1 Tax=Algoriphagus sp. AGSA1 TaxID=2907213 RepID=UPI001F29BE4B|nr:DUF4249 domain-containing protein [Algoriphagus sp. AGSA1]MCE7056372.1 DUF4249 domain-containing protein [Algoriphagus sp. AGSA1]
MLDAISFDFRAGQLCFFVVALSFIIGCREPYSPEILPKDVKVLVVEGYLDTEGLPSILRLSFTKNLDAEVDEGFPEAEVYLKADSGAEFPLTDIGNGEFEFAQDIPEEMQYTLHIVTEEGKTYTSEKLSPILTPEIAELGFEKDEEGVEIFIRTKGGQNAEYFMWDYEEIYSFRPAVPTYFKYDAASKDIVYLEENERTDICYREGTNEELISETSIRFQEDVVFRKKLIKIFNGDERLSMKYSVLVSQRAISKDAEEFWRILNKNSTELGSIFSPLPSIMPSNLRQEGNPDAPVIGYVSMGIIRQQRLFISLREVMPWQVADIPEYFQCQVSDDTIPISAYEEFFGSGDFVPATPISVPGVPYIVGYQGTERRCADCTLRGTNVKPDFWDD